MDKLDIDDGSNKGNLSCSNALKRRRDATRSCATRPVRFNGILDSQPLSQATPATLDPQSDGDLDK